jgi:hypothetical protein
MDTCSRQPTTFAKDLQVVQEALQKTDGYEEAFLNTRFGLKPGTPGERDCTVEVDAPHLKPGTQGRYGAIIRVHDLYVDPALTNCSRVQSQRAGRSFLNWLKRKGIRIHLVASSFLMRAVETAYGMFRAPCEGPDAMNCTGLFVDEKPLITPVPYMTERAPAGLTAIEQDNTPREARNKRE